MKTNRQLSYFQAGVKEKSNQTFKNRPRVYSNKVYSFKN